MKVSLVNSNGVNMMDIESRIFDIARNGTKQIIVDRYIDRYEGADQAPMEQRIYELVDDSAIDSSKKYRDYYAVVIIPKLRSKLGAVKSDKSGPSTSPVHDDYQEFIIGAELERAKLQSLGE